MQKQKPGCLKSSWYFKVGIFSLVENQSTFASYLCYGADSSFDKPSLVLYKQITTTHTALQNMLSSSTSLKGISDLQRVSALECSTQCLDELLLSPRAGATTGIKP